MGSRAVPTASFLTEDFGTGLKKPLKSGENRLADHKIKISKSQQTSARKGIAFYLQGGWSSLKL